VAALASSACGRNREQRLNVFNWSNYVAPETIPEFEREYGVRVRYATYESNEEMAARVFSGNSGWDVVFPTNTYVVPLRQQGLLAPLRHEWLPNLRHLEPLFRMPEWDPGLRYSVPYMWGATGIVYHRKLGWEPCSWASLWDHRLRGRLTMLDDPAEVFGAALKMRGHSVNSSDVGELRAAQREALRQKPLVRAYLNAEVRDQLASGDVLCAQLWNTTAQQAMDASPDLRFAFPAEGFALYADNMAVLRESGRQALAHQFVNYLLRPEVAARIVTATRTATANETARRQLAPAVARNRVLYPDTQTMARGEWFATLPSAVQRLRDRLWTEIKAG
jgi:spermidine/putrescine transport system substrate-binding protein